MATSISPGRGLPGQSHSARNQAASTADFGRFPSEGRKAFLGEKAVLVSRSEPEGK